MLNCANRAHNRSIRRNRIAECADIMVRVFLILTLPLVAFACGDQRDPEPGEPRFYEWSIDSVWHRAKLRGVAFRAIGQEPGWLLEITNGTEILLVTDYG